MYCTAALSNIRPERDVFAYAQNYVVFSGRSGHIITLLKSHAERLFHKDVLSALYRRKRHRLMHRGRHCHNHCRKPGILNGGFPIPKQRLRS
jgi:hypothetical protein